MHSVIHLWNSKPVSGPFQCICAIVCETETATGFVNLVKPAHITVSALLPFCSDRSSAGAIRETVYHWRPGLPSRRLQLSGSECLLYGESSLTLCNTRHGQMVIRELTSV